MAPRSYIRRSTRRKTTSRSISPHGSGKNRVRKSQNEADEEINLFAIEPSTSITVAIPAPAANDKPFRFLDLPGEMRNMIYEYCLDDTDQALITHLPGRAGLRPRKSANPKRREARKVHGLTQVCRSVRKEFRPMYLIAQEIGLDIMEVNKYIEAFYPLSTKPDKRVGNITIAISNRLSQWEKNHDGMDILPMLDAWANSFRMEAGFGRYYYTNYNSNADGEAKDLYRLFGRKVLPNRKTSNMNREWRNALRRQKLAEVRVYRLAPRFGRPYIHVLYKREHREAWMRSEDTHLYFSKFTENWTHTHEWQPTWDQRFGFDEMQYFDLKVGVIDDQNNPTTELWNRKLIRAA